ncbi:uncharacterized protein N7483_000487 [Penicillium malachiteum]|uniref:uncharacterized protein n=1 Tax=Penicillium malachiteum TaxID=1324776 RepID=UPI0025491B53|nr:uncharacterized protein N7483_000487 [Penicillium malachiteum]KAJ5735362.1 hypothetical protein N7483_000487 [Penicillium malachiteum]
MPVKTPDKKPENPRPTQNLVRNNMTRELRAGETFIARFKSSFIGHKTDIWLCVILTEEFGPGKHCHGRPKGAKPAEGAWTTPLNERMYPIYMPGRNDCRWILIKDIYILGESVPEFLAHSKDRDNVSLFRKLQRIALKVPNCKFWEKMAEKEMQLKGKRSRNPSLTLPDGYEDILTDSEAEEVAGYDTDEGPAELDAGYASPPPAKVQARTASFSVSREIKVSGAGDKLPKAEKRQIVQHLSFPGESSSFLNYASTPGLSFGTTSSETSTQQGSVEVQKNIPPLTSLSPIKLKREKKTKSNAAQEPDEDIWKLSMSEVAERVLVQGPRANELLEIFHEMLKVQRQPESAKIKSFMQTSEFSPRLSQINNPANNWSNDTANKNKSGKLLGDYLEKGRILQLESVRDSNTLQQEIVSLGHLYKYARRFQKPKLIKMIAIKLQVAWNSYPGLCQLKPILDVASIVCQDFSLTTKDYLQNWILNFIADTMDLFLHDCSEKYWSAMRALPDLFDAVTKLRAEFIVRFPGRYSDVRVLLSSRGIDQI